jgi:hypothetical protein
MTVHPFKADMEIGSLVARYIAATSTMEVLISAVFARMIGDDGRITHVILHQFRNLSDRIAVLRDVVKLYKEDDSTRHSIEPLIPLMSWCSGFRNKLAHGIFTRDDDSGEIMLICWVASKQKKTENMVISHDLLERELKKLGDLNEKLLGQGFGAGQPFSFPGK